MACGVELEQKNALKDVSFYTNERGLSVTFVKNDESTVNRDRYGSIKKKTGVNTILKALPVIYNPTQNQLDKAGIRETVDVLITLAMGDLIALDIDYDSFDEIRWRVFMQGETFVIKSKNRINRFSDVFLNIVLGLTKE